MLSKTFGNINGFLEALSGGMTSYWLIAQICTNIYTLSCDSFCSTKTFADFLILAM